MRPLIYHVATSVDGFIARSNGSFEDFSWDEDVVQDFLTEIAQCDAVVMGRKTYEVGLAEGKTNPYPNLESFVFSRSISESPDPAINLIAAEAEATVRKLKRRSGNAIWLCGGADLASQLFAAGLVDELVIKLYPVAIGGGISLFSRLIQPTHLTLLEHTVYEGGTIRVRYRVCSPKPK